jgi:hypothetical protein
MILLKKYNLLFVIILFAPIISGQDIFFLKGEIKNNNGLPISNANIKVLNLKSGTVSNEKGEFKVTIEDQSKVTLEITHVNYRKISKSVNPKKDTVIKIKMKNKVLKTLEVEYKDPGSSPTEILPNINASSIALPSGNIEGLLSSVGYGVRQNNELSSGFSVRGGNFDENLIYVNGIEVYRPFLARSGQQEGLSFINPSMVENIVFSAGGLMQNMVTNFLVFWTLATENLLNLRLIFLQAF